MHAPATAGGTHAADVDDLLAAMRLPASVAPAPSRFKRILVALDETEGSRDALRWATWVARASGGGLSLAHVVQAPTAVGVEHVGYFGYLNAFAAARARGRELLHEARERLDREGLHADTVQLEGGVPQEIARRAESDDVDLVVVGANRSPHLQRAMLGTTSRAVLERARCSVLVARGAPPPRTILAATDGSPAASLALRQAARLSAATPARLVVQHVLAYGAERRDGPSASMVDGVRCVVDAGLPGPEIERRAREEDAELIVVGSSGMGRIERWLLGSVSRRVAERAEAAVLVVKQPTLGEGVE